MADEGGFPTIKNVDKEEIEAKRRAVASRMAGGKKPTPASDKPQD